MYFLAFCACFVAASALPDVSSNIVAIRFRSLFQPLESLRGHLENACKIRSQTPCLPFERDSISWNGVWTWISIKFGGGLEEIREDLERALALDL